MLEKAMKAAEKSGKPVKSEHEHTSILKSSEQLK
jgi:hypothetical protein